MIYKLFFKRTFDTFVALSLLLLLSPLILVLIFVLFFLNTRQVFFVQERPGRNGKIFKIIKFKTMADTRDGHGNLLPDGQRITKIGKWMRRRSLDEIPQLFNVLWGDMSLVGPRPLLPEYLEKYDGHQQRRHEVLPGITGWAQVNGRNGICWEEKFRLDVWYVDNQSAFLDGRILLKTIGSVFRGKGVNQEGQASMLPFKGSAGYFDIVSGHTAKP